MCDAFKACSLDKVFRFSESIHVYAMYISVTDAAKWTGGVSGRRRGYSQPFLFPYLAAYVVIITI